jgi:hypothetical protein
MTFEEKKQEFYEERSSEDGAKIMLKATAIINEIGRRFLTLDGGELAEMQTKLIGYKFYLADYVSDLNRDSERLKLEMKERRARLWDDISERIRVKDGKVKNKEQIENVLTTDLMEIAQEQILYETFYNKYKLKMSAINDIITAIVQRISEKKMESETARFQK